MWCSTIRKKLVILGEEENNDHPIKGCSLLKKLKDEMSLYTFTSTNV